MASDFPEDHPLAGKEHLLDTHAGHLEALGEVLDEADPDAVQGAMLVLVGEDGSDTIPTVAPDADARWLSLWMLGTHIHHAANAATQTTSREMSMEEAAQDAIHAVTQHARGDGQ